MLIMTAATSCCVILEASQPEQVYEVSRSARQPASQPCQAIASRSEPPSKYSIALAGCPEVVSNTSQAGKQHQAGNTRQAGRRAREAARACCRPTEGRSCCFLARPMLLYE